MTNKTETLTSKDGVEAAFNRAVKVLGELFAGKQSIREVAPQTVGCERYRLTFSGARFSEANVAMADLGIAIRRAHAPETEGCAHCREVYEIWAGSEGMIPETAPEAYLSRVMIQMRDAAAVGMFRPAQETEAGATCKWTEIEEGTGKFNTCKPGESFHLSQGMDLYPFCHWCGREIEVTDDCYIHGPGTFPHSDGCLCSKCKPYNGKPNALNGLPQQK